MSDYELISPEEYGSLPDDLEQCFVELEGICRRNMIRMMSEARDSDVSRTLVLTYVSVIIAAADECKVGELNFDGSDNFWNEYENFSRSVQGIIAKLRIRGRRGGSEQSVQLTVAAKAKIEHYVARLRKAIADSDLDNARKASLDKKLDDFVKDLQNGPRLSLARAMAALALVTATVAGATTIAADGPQAIQHILGIIGSEKQTEDEAVRRLAPPQKLLTASTKAIASPKQGSFGRRAANTLDDDIPF